MTAIEGKPAAMNRHLKNRIMVKPANQIKQFFVEDAALQATLPVDEETCADSYADCDPNTASCFPEFATKIGASLFNIGIAAMAGVIPTEPPAQIDIAVLMRGAEEKIVIAKSFPLKQALSSHYEPAMTAYKRIETFAVSTGQIKLQLIALQGQVEVIQQIIFHATEFEEPDADKRYEAVWLVKAIAEISRKTSEFSGKYQHSDADIASAAEFIKAQVLQAGIELQRAGVVGAGKTPKAEEILRVERSYKAAAELAVKAGNYVEETHVLKAHLNFLVNIELTLTENHAEAEALKAKIESIFGRLDDTLRLESQRLFANGNFLDLADISVRRAQIILEAAKLDALYWEAELLENGEQQITFRFNSAMSVLEFSQKYLADELEKAESAPGRVAILTRLSEIQMIRLRAAIERYKVFETAANKVRRENENAKSTAAINMLNEAIERFREDFTAFLSRQRLARYSDRKNIAKVFKELGIAVTTENLIEALAAGRRPLHNELIVRGVPEELYDRLVTEAQAVYNERFGIARPRADWHQSYRTGMRLSVKPARTAAERASNLQISIDQLSLAKKQMIQSGQYDDADVIGASFHFAKAMRLRSIALEEMKKAENASANLEEIQGARNAALETHLFLMEEFPEQTIGRPEEMILGHDGALENYDREVQLLIRTLAGKDPSKNPDIEDYRQLILIQAKIIEANDIRTAWGQSWLLRAFRAFGTNTEPMTASKNTLMAALANGEADDVLREIFGAAVGKTDQIKSNAEEYLTTESRRASVRNPKERGSAERPAKRPPMWFH
ncbi:MAG: hypothetical protein HYY43_05610 [Deltaproteobacteria bacterium]|nr:hypothetical protein [Deltaproteobacteria bacterium]MBI2341668.1 hypothetical protein [Deltaproteobacteria bacterium]MBI2975047.1 hypothetical protein [Deltaproteobacteria bacterium]